MRIKQEVAKPLMNDIALAVWRLLPANPIVLRVVQGGSKRIQHLWVRVLYLLILFGVMLIAQFANSSSGQSLTSLAKSSTRIFEIIATLQLAMMCFLSPIFTAGAISQEKDAETFNVLLTTPLTNAQIVLGSLGSRLFFVMALLVAGLPIFSITMIFGGVTSEQIFLSFGIAGSTAILTGSLAILVSVVRVGSRGTIFSFYVGIAFYLFAGLVLGMSPWTYVQESIIPGVNTGMTWLAIIHPYYALEVALNLIRPPEAVAVAHYAWPLNHMLASPQWAYMALTLLTSIVLVGFSTIFLRSGIKQGEAGFIRRLQLKFGRKKTGDERRHRIRKVWANPIAWREAVTKASAASSGAMRYSYLIGGAVAGALFLYAYGSGWMNISAGPNPRTVAREWLIGIVMVEFLVVLLMAANTAATAITRERDDGTMELLLTTPLTSKYIVWGKLRGLISFAVPLMAVPAATVLAAAIFDLARGVAEPVVPLLSAVLLPFLLAVYASFACMIGLQMSLKSKKSVQAVMASIGILVVVAFGLFLCAMGTSQVDPQIASVTVPLTFVTAIYYVLDPSSIGHGRGPYPDTTQIQALLFIGTVIAVALYGAIVAGTYRSMVTNFDMIVRKQQK